MYYVWISLVHIIQLNVYYIFIQLLEICMSLTIHVSHLQCQIWVYGNSFESFLVAIVNPNKDALERWATENGVGGDFKSLCENPNVKEFILGELVRVAKEKKVTFFFFYNIYLVDCH